MYDVEEKRYHASDKVAVGEVDGFYSLNGVRIMVDPLTAGRDL